MRKSLTVMVVFSFVAGLAEAAPRQMLLNGSDTQTSIVLDKETLAVIELDSNVSTGYAWRVAPSLYQRIDWLGNVYVDSQSGKLGEWGHERIYLAAKQQGAEKVKLEYVHASGNEVLASLTYSFVAKEPFSETFEVPQQQEYVPPSELTVTNLVGLPAHLNWCEQNGCTPVKNQGSCGSCWAFGTVGTMEQALKINDGVSKDLSEQYLLSCN